MTTDQRLETLKKNSVACDEVIHTACRRSNASEGNLDALYRDNEEATRGLIAALPRPTPIIYTSSLCIYGTPSASPDENTSPTPCDAYGHSKYKTEQVLRDSEHKSRILRIGALWGFGYDRYGRTFLDECLQRVKTQQPLTLLTEPAIRDHLFIWDAARWIHTMITQSIDVPLLNMAGETIALQDKVQRLCAHAPKNYAPVINWKQGRITHALPLLDTSLWQRLCKTHSFSLTPWSVLEQQAWEERRSYNSVWAVCWDRLCSTYSKPAETS